MEQLGLARREDGRWYAVEKRTADQLMKYLAIVVAYKNEMLPTTDSVRARFYKPEVAIKQRKRETILTELIPFPENIDIYRLRRFKELHIELLQSFKNRVEQIVLDPNIIEGTELFNERLRELRMRKEELSAKMNESQFGNILFGTVCGLIGAIQGLSAAETPGALIGAFPGFASAVHSALKIEKAEDIFDQSGLKYLALADKRLRR